MNQENPPRRAFQEYHDREDVFRENEHVNRENVMELTNALIRLGAKPSDKTQAIREAAKLLVENGKVAPGYGDGMLARENQENTYLGNGVAIPHATANSRHLIHETAIAVLQVPDGVDWGEGETARLIVAIAAADTEHLGVLKRLSAVVGNEAVADRLCRTGDVDEIRAALSVLVGAPLDAPTAAPDPARGEKFLVAVTSCPTGVAHTYMAEEALTAGARTLGMTIKVETQGSVGAENVLGADDIARADGVIIAADTHVALERFTGKKVYRTGTRAAINDGVAVIETALAEATVHGGAAGGDDLLTRTAAAKAERKATQGGIYKHLMTGVSYMLPFVVAGGLLIALGFAVGSFMYGGQGIFIYEEQYQGTLGAILFAIGKNAFTLFVPVLGAYIAYSIAGRPGIAPGMVGALIAADSGAGFLGAILAGFIAGYFVAALARSIRLPRSLDSLKPMIILPLVGTLVVGLLMYTLIAEPVAYLLQALTGWLESLQGTSSGLLGALIGAMMAFDMGGPVNKAAYTFSTALIGSNIFAPMAAVMAAGMTPPIAIFVATLIFKTRFSAEERQAGKAAGVLGISFITEGAIPFAAKDPLRVIPALMIGSAVAGVMSMYFDCQLRAPHGGVFVLFIPHAVSHIGLYLVALAAGTAVSAALLGVLKKKATP